MSAQAYQAALLAVVSAAEACVKVLPTDRKARPRCDCPSCARMRVEEKLRDAVAKWRTLEDERAKRDKL